VDWSVDDNPFEGILIEVCKLADDRRKHTIRFLASRRVDLAVELVERRGPRGHPRKSKRFSFSGKLDLCSRQKMALLLITTRRK
jgi:hypothetical protein